MSSPPVASKAMTNGVPNDALDTVLAAQRRGLGHMERYEYADAAKAFREVTRLAPGWSPGAINLAIALLNDTGAKTEEAKQGGGSEPVNNFDEALALLDEVIRREPENIHAIYCRGLIREYVGDTAQAHADFLTVSKLDPHDGHTWLKIGATLTDPKNPIMPASIDQADELITFYTKALECNPYLVPAMYKLSQAYAWARKPDKQAELTKLWLKLDPSKTVTGTGDTGESFYGEAGRYARLVSGGIESTSKIASPLIPPRFDLSTPLKVDLPPGDRWAQDDGKPSSTIAHLDVNGDGRHDLYLGRAVQGPKGLRDALLVQRPDGSFEDVTLRAGLPGDRPSLTIAFSDFDSDRRIDLFRVDPDGLHLYRNLGDLTFEEITSGAKITAPEKVQSSDHGPAYWLDLDQDGDLDLFVVFPKASKEQGPGSLAFRNDGQPPPIASRPQDNWAPIAVAEPDLKSPGGLSLAFSPWGTTPESAPLLGTAHDPTALAAFDVDDDRDLDLILGNARGGLEIVLNERLGRFRAAPAVTWPEGLGTEPIQGLLTLDANQDGLSDLVILRCNGPVQVLRNRSERGHRETPIAFELVPCDARGWRSAIAVDLDLDRLPDLLGVAGDGPAVPVWSRNEGERFKTESLVLGPDSSNGGELAAFDLADLGGDPLPDLIVRRSGEPPQVSRSLGNGRHWLALDLSGRWKIRPEQMRTNAHGLGSKVTVQGQGLSVFTEFTTPTATGAQSVGPIVLGLGDSASADLLRIRWPDGVMQCELNVSADRRLLMAENNRKTGSCPVVFTWNGERFVCLGDILGGGGLGYLVAPGVYSQPDRDEAMAIRADQLRAEQGIYRIAIAEPMDEVAYLDRVTLDVVDTPPGLNATPDERFSPGGNRPSGKLLAWKETIEPVRVTDLQGKDLGDLLKHWDRRTADGFRKRQGWIGYAEEHGIVLDFGDRLAGPASDARLALCLAGWVEYPYSQTNYAAATAGVTLSPPVLERLDENGKWVVLEPDPGYPAGLPRMTTLELTGKLSGPRCVLRLRTNMECYWDQAFLARLETTPQVRVTTLDVTRAEHGPRGYLREVSPDGRLPLLYEYDYVDPAPLARLTGKLTRYGDATRWLRSDDDQFCLVGPGDQVRMEFDASRLPALSEGWTRSFVIRAVGYCKDVDPFTATSDTVGPLPWKGMGDYPFGPSGERPKDAEYRRYLDDDLTRSVGP